MKRKMFKLMVCMFALLLCGTVALSEAIVIPVVSSNLPDTGQTTCYDGAGIVIDPCPAPGQPLAQDGSYSINPMSFTDNGTTVTDNNTGLVWQKEDDGTPRTWAAAGSYCSLLGSGWRLPTKKELMRIVDYSIPEPGPKINPIFTNTELDYYWSSTDFAYDTTSAWGVSFGVGFVIYHSKGTTASYVRCVK